MQAYRPPPAHAHAQPAHAQAHAHAQLPPPLEYPRLLVEGFGGGLVTCVTPLVKPVTFLTMRLDVPWIPLTIEAAKAAPGNVGRLTRPDGLEPLEGTRAGRRPAVPTAGRVQGR
jgi:hypothetical protein